MCHTISIPVRYERRSLKDCFLRPHVERSGKIDETASLRHAAAGLGGRAAAGNVRGGPRYDGGRGSIAISCQTIRCATRQPTRVLRLCQSLLHVCLLAPYLAPCFAWRVRAARAEAGGGQPSPTPYLHAPQLPNSQPSPSSTHWPALILPPPSLPATCRPRATCTAYRPHAGSTLRPHFSSF